MNRYANRQVLRNDHEQYREVLKNRSVKYIDQYNTPKFKVPTVDEIKMITTIGHIWKAGDRLYKLAYQYYNGRSELWWVIAWWNQKPTEAHISVGDTLMIPLPIDRVLHAYGV